MISLDTETTGLDIRHGAKPFFLTSCDQKWNVTFWEWDVDPLTRDVIVPDEDIQAVGNLIWGVSGDDGPDIVMQNGKFDVAALATILPSFTWPWEKTHDTLLAGHLLASNRPHDLTSMGVQYLGVDISPYEERLKQACDEARAYCRTHLKEWAIAKEGRPDMPSASETVWKYDTWLPRALAKELNIPEEGHEKSHYWTVLRDYANADSACTIALWNAQLEEIKRRKLWDIYLIRRKCSQLAHDMEKRGITLIKSHLLELQKDYGEDSQKAGTLCQNIADSFPPHEVPCPRCVSRGKTHAKTPLKRPELIIPCKVCGDKRNQGRIPFKFELPKGASPNNSIRTFAFEVMKLPELQGKKAKTDLPSLDRPSMEFYLLNLPPKSKPHNFIRSLSGKRSRDTALAFLASYAKYWKVVEGAGFEDVMMLFPSLNPTGTHTLRWTSSNPNEQQISKQGMKCLNCLGRGCFLCGDKGIDYRNLRYCFGPEPGREWWSLDAKNIELRLPFYKSGEQVLIDLFERPDEPPYYGSNHLLNFHTAYPELWESEAKVVGYDKVGPHVKKKYGSSWYQWCKNGGFALQYQAGKATADRAFHADGAYDKIKGRFKNLTELNRKQCAFAERHGYIETMPDKTVDPERGYPLLCTRTEQGRILETIPLSYYIQGTAMWWMMKAMIRCDAQLQEWTRDGFRSFIAMQVHDEMVFDLPKKADPKKDPKRSNLGRMKVIARLMEEGGNDLGIPTPVGMEFHDNNWAEGVTLQ